ncbi:hypothetical protein D3C72_1763640 [compost metagenome]
MAQASPQAHMPHDGSSARALRKARTDSVCSNAQRSLTPWSNQAWASGFAVSILKPPVPKPSTMTMSLVGIASMADPPGPQTWG